MYICGIFYVYIKFLMQNVLCSYCFKWILCGLNNGEILKFK